MREICMLRARRRELEPYGRYAALRQLSTLPVTERERAALVGGTVEIESRPGGGATVVVRIAVPPALGLGEADE